MKAQNRKEIFLKALANGEEPKIKPLTREEVFLAKQAKRESESTGGTSDCDWNTMKNKPFGEEITEEIIYENGEYNYPLENFEDMTVTATLLDGTEGEYTVTHIYENGEDGDYDYYALVDEDGNELENSNIKSIRYYDTAITPLEEKFIPYTIARVEDMNILISPNGIPYKLSVSDDGTLTATEV